MRRHYTIGDGRRVCRGTPRTAPDVTDDPQAVTCHKCHLWLIRHFITHTDPAVETVLADMVCPHCAGRAGTCHACDGTGRLSFERVPQAMVWMWARQGCACAACVRAGEAPPSAGGQNDMRTTRTTLTGVAACVAALLLLTGAAAHAADGATPPAAPATHAAAIAAPGDAAVTMQTTATVTRAAAVAFTPSADDATVFGANPVTGYQLNVYSAASTRLVAQTLGHPAPDATNTVTVDIFKFLTPLPVGNYTVSVTTVGVGGALGGESTTIPFTLALPTNPGASGRVVLISK